MKGEIEMGNLLILVGMGFFIKLFFQTLEKAKKTYDSDKKVSKKYIYLHLTLGIIFILIGNVV
ncbi:hypothetical protein [Ligilactobacillus salivarius]